jgi:serine/threonine-protein kinase
MAPRTKVSLLHRLSRVSAVFLIVWTAGVLGFLYVWLPWYVRGEVVTVPDFGKMPLEEARMQARRMGLSVAEPEERPDNAIARGHVVSHVPAPGQRVKENRPITFVVSSGPEMVEVPDLTEKSLREGEYELALAGLDLGARIYVYSDDVVVADTIITTSPSPEALAPYGSAVNVLLSRGPRPVDLLMPQLVGMNIEEARRLLGRYRLGMSDVIERLDTGAAPGIVLAQYPQQNAIISSGERVTLTVNQRRARDMSGARTVIIEHRTNGTAEDEVRLKIVVQDEAGRHEILNGFVSGGRRISQPRVVQGKATLYVYEQDMETPLRREELR